MTWRPGVTFDRPRRRGLWICAVALCAACSTRVASEQGDAAILAGGGGVPGVGGADGAGGTGGAGAERAPDAGPGTLGDAGDDGAGGRDGQPPPSSGPGDWKAGDYPPDLGGQTYLEIDGVPGQAGNVRQYKVHVPASYRSERPTPLVFCFHGLSQDPIMFCVNGAGMVEKSDAEGFILVMPSGFQNSWNGGTCCGGAVTSQLDDVALVRAIFDEVKGHLNVDLSRVYATGLSNGGYMSYRLACEASDIFVAVAPGAGAIGMNDIGGGTSAAGDFAQCEPSQAVSVLDMHGTADGLVSYATQQPSLARIAMRNGCGASTSPASQPESAGDTKCVSHDACPDGVDVTGCTVMNGGHVWFGDESCGTGAGPAGCGFVGANSDQLVNTDAAWAFFATHAR